MQTLSAASALLGAVVLLLGGFPVSAQTPIVVSGEYAKLKVLKPYDPLLIYFKVPSSFVGSSLVVDAAFADQKWDVDGLKLTRLNSTFFGLSQPTTVAPMTGFHDLVWSAATGTTATASLNLTIEVSCSDGDVCNGMERLVWHKNGKMKCVSTKKPLCDDNNVCTEDTCNNGVCSHKIIKSAFIDKSKCPSCKGTSCTPNCKGRICGGDGCGGVCGDPCAGDGEYCIKGKCVVKELNGTCKTPYDLTSQAVALKWKGYFEVTGDTSKGINVIVPQCNSASLAPEIMYFLKVPSNAGYVGIDARAHSTKKLKDGSYDVSALDTVMQIIEIDPARFPNASKGCLSANGDATLTVACADDSSPPGSYSSRVTWMLKPGYSYYIQVDGYSARDVGPFLLEIRLTPECTMACQGKFCGASGCAGFDCGFCAGNSTCSSDGLSCIPPKCKPKCSKSKKRCGADGCGGTCGVCDASANEFCLDGVCSKFPYCNPLLPACHYQVVAQGGGMRTVSGCPSGHYCASDCKCRTPDEPLPDLSVAGEYVFPEIVNNYVIENTSCALAEGCVNKAGLRRIVKFSTNIYNQGSAPFNPPSPPQSRPDLFEWAPCHGHYHFQQFARFELLNLKNETVVEGQKRSYCAEDSSQYWTAHPKMLCEAKYSCTRQGISIGWMDIYGPNLDCQFLDITDVAPGNYSIRQCANYRRVFAEETFENNCVTNPVYIPAKP